MLLLRRTFEAAEAARCEVTLSFMRSPPFYRYYAVIILQKVLRKQLFVERRVEKGGEKVGIFSKKPKQIIELDITVPVDYFHGKSNEGLIKKIKEIREALPDYELRVKIKNR